MCGDIKFFICDINSFDPIDFVVINLGKEQKKI